MTRQIFHDNSMTLLMAAFEPFGGRSCNTSADLLQTLKSAKMPTGIHLSDAVVLPVNFSSAWHVLHPHILDTKPDLILLMGEKKGGSLTIENQARNWRRHGSTHRIIERGARDLLPGKLPARNLLAELPLAMRSEFTESNDAGDFLCNFIFFKTLLHAQETPAMFLHVAAKSPRQFEKTAAANVKAIFTLLSAIRAHLKGSDRNLFDTKAIDGTGTNDMPRENKRRLLMADKHLVACEQEHEMITVLKHFKKGSSKENIDKMQNACRSWKKDGGAKYKPKNRDNFYKYLQEKGVLGKLA